MKLLKNKISKKFYHAGVGLIDVLKNDQSIRLQCLIACVVLLFCCFLPLQVWQWCFMIMMCALVIICEMINTVIELCVDFICPQFDIRAKRIKDIAAGMVLFVSLIAVVIGILIIGGILL